MTYKELWNMLEGLTQDQLNDEVKVKLDVGRINADCDYSYINVSSAKFSKSTLFLAEDGQVYDANEAGMKPEDIQDEIYIKENQLVLEIP